LLQGDGTPLLDALEEAPLRDIARLTGGHYFHAASENALADVYRRIDALEKSPLLTRRHTARTPVAPLLLHWAAALLAVDLLIFRCWLRRAP
jgi:Ca-activated chloride channel homolog